MPALLDDRPSAIVAREFTDSLDQGVSKEARRRQHPARMGT
jgi:hypothetical protein